VVPLHGRGNVGGAGEGVKVLAYRKPADPRAPWPVETLDASLHLTHNFDLVDGAFPQPPRGGVAGPGRQVVLASKEGIYLLERKGESWTRSELAGKDSGAEGFRGAGEVRAGKLSGGKAFLAAVEPFHGNELVVYTRVGEKGGFRRKVIDGGLKEGHALACADLLRAGGDQVVCGWRMPDAAGKVGIRIYAPLDPDGREWKASPLDDGGMACEDLKVGDLDGDGRPDVVAAGRATHNLKVYWNRE
jgi:hypothetical protein